ncbi:winged helix-turn-helix domain-containing protein [uncultured Enterococcus sp.]|uniref:response regulator transcription factor n=1 Tax=uncultured Enterococcus sp. TaxID=167972 RepID=UPI002AA6CAFE|nr:winged helix-turn-helix domain-containing protein [uncultured Enterococcus sp.]
MYQIGFVSNNGLPDNRHVEVLKSDESFSLLEMPLKNNVEEVGEMDALIIQSDSEGEVGKVCELLIKIRKHTSAQIWIFSDELPKTTRLILLQLGADGIVDSQIDPEEYQLILKNSLRHGALQNMSQSLADAASGVKEFKLVPSNLSVVVDGNREVGLTKLEFKTIELLYRKKSEAIPYQAIYRQVWNNKEESENLKFRVANLIFHLRRKIEKDPLKPEYIKTVRSRGYVLNV